MTSIPLLLLLFHYNESTMIPLPPEFFTSFAQIFDWDFIGSRMCVDFREKGGLYLRDIKIAVRVQSRKALSNQTLVFKIAPLYPAFKLGLIVLVYLLGRICFSLDDK